MYWLRELGGERAVEPLIACLTNRSFSSCREVITALAKIGDPRAVDPLIACLTNRSFSPRSEVVTALGKIGDPRAVDPIIECLEECGFRPTIDRTQPFNSYDLPIATVKALGQLKGPKASAALAKCYRLQDSKLMGYCFDGLGWQASLQVACAETNSSTLLQETITCIFKRGITEALPELERILKERGTKKLAEFYLNSDNSDLRVAALDWARAHDFTPQTLTVPGSNYPKWQTRSTPASSMQR